MGFLSRMFIPRSARRAIHLDEPSAGRSPRAR
jgi:hypothetical protein